MACINERYVYILGGFDLLGGKIDEIYLNDMEYLDINDFSKGWTMINYINNNGYNMALIAPGIIPISKNIFLICGGYEGKEYKNSVYKIDGSNHEKPTIEEIECLPNKTIFNHTNFCKIQNSYFNIDINSQIYEFDYDRIIFRTIKMNQNN